MKDFRDLKVWELAHEITLELYTLTKLFPSDEKFGLTSQIRRAAASIGANIAEGCGKKGNAEFHRFLQHSSGSAWELEYHLLLAKDLGYLVGPKHFEVERKLLQLKRMLSALMTKIEEAKTKSKGAGAD